MRAWRASSAPMCCASRRSCTRPRTRAAQVRARLRGGLVAVGSGTLTDIVRYAAHSAGCDFVSVPTAASMDGYASSVAALERDGVKLTLPARAPAAIFADPRIAAARAERADAGRHRRPAREDDRAGRLARGAPALRRGLARARAAARARRRRAARRRRRRRRGAAARADRLGARDGCGRQLASGERLRAPRIAPLGPARRPRRAAAGAARAPGRLRDGLRDAPAAVRVRRRRGAAAAAASRSPSRSTPLRARGSASRRRTCSPPSPRSSAWSPQCPLRGPTIAGALGRAARAPGAVARHASTRSPMRCGAPAFPIASRAISGSTRRCCAPDCATAVGCARAIRWSTSSRARACSRRRSTLRC